MLERKASLTDDARGLDKQSFTPSNSGNLNLDVTGVSEFPALGVAICDAELRYVNVNNALAVMNGVPAEAHIGRTVREVTGSVGSSIELMMGCVLFTGQSVLNLEVMGKLPTRNEVGYWIANYFPVHDSTGGVKQVGALVVEITSLRKLEMCLPTLLGNMPRTIAQVKYLGMPYDLEKVSPELWSGSVEMVENSVREMLRIQKVQPPAQTPNIGDRLPHQRLHLLYASPAIPNDSSGHKHGSIPTGDNGAKPLSPREIEVVQLLATAKGNKEISAALKISVKTVEAYRAKIMLKLQIHSIAELVRYAVRCGLVKA
jgi:DNA-binding CsgD family transcriptional regulator